MNLKRIELIGFKSFADKIEVDFDSGITAIVGPNGCGKSNIADAIRWVLGEQSSKLLRGTSMQDVIFNGTERRKSLSYCEVSVYLDNSSHTLDIPYDEIVISRKLYRSGESEYLINKTTARLKEIVEILHDSGIGRDGYSIIGQGKVDEIVSSKPENRRSIFEEAAGIAKFKDKKRESERKLERTRDNMARLKDIYLEIENRLLPLKDQAETARKYLNFKEQLKSLEINNYLYNYDNASTFKADIGTKINALTEEINVKQADLDTTITKYNKNMDDINKIDKNIQDLYNQVVDLKVSIEKKSGETNVLKERLNILHEQKEKLEEELEQYKQNLNKTTLLVEQKEQQKIDNENLIEELKIKAEKVSSEYMLIIDELTKNELDAEENQQLMYSALDKLSDIKADMSKLSAEKVSAIEKQANFINEIQQIQAKLIILNQEKEKLSQDIKQNEQKREETKLQNAHSVENVRAYTQKVDTLNNDLYKLNSTISSLNSRQKLLQEMQKSYDGFNGAVKNVLQAKEVNAELKNKVIGVVASLMKVPKEYETAIEMALGGQVQNIVTENEDDARKIIDFLKQNNFGRATFLPITSAKSRNLWEYKNLINSTKGSFGIASELISFEPKLKPIFENLLGATVIVDNLITAVSLAKQSRYGFKIVTLEGDVINPQGSITGGSKQYKVSNIVGREREIEDTIKQVNSLQNQLEVSQAELIKTKEKLQAEIQTQNDLTDEIYTYEILIAKSNESLSKITADISVQNEQLQNNNNLLEEVQATIRAIDINLEKTGTKQADLNSNKSNVNENLAKRQARFNELKTQRDEYNETVLNVKVKIASLQSEIISLGVDIERLNKEAIDLRSEIEITKGYIDQNIATIDEGNRVIENKLQDTNYVETNKKLEEVKNKLASLDDYKQNLQSELKVLEEDRVNLTTRISKLQDKVFQENINLTKIDTDIENMQNRIWEEYELSYATANTLRVENYDLQEGMKNAGKVKREIDKLGYVNVHAIEESQVEQTRYDELAVQIADLTKAEGDLTQIINDLAVEMTSRFETSFKSINENFSKVFKELFGGGRAELVLTEPESGDPLDAGVDIIAEPPGKKLQNISLLSGGEKAITAIAILFAILKMRPMPFVLLDEIEAALDDSNVYRFAKYLKRFSDETQFIVITHRKPTMELADRLYGVTMQEKGVSNIVSVKLSDALEIEN